jgi:seryl-tRNA synthetase
MLDIRLIRNELETVREAIARRGEPSEKLDELARLDEARRRLIGEAEELKRQRNVVSQEINQLKRAGQDAEEKIVAMRGVSDRIKELDEELRSLDGRIEALLAGLPNLPDPRVPEGKDESENVVLRTEGEPRDFDFPAQPHWELGERLGILHFEWGVKLAGSRFYVLSGYGARLQRALIQWMLDLHIQRHGYAEVYTPFVVREEVLFGAGQLPKFRDNLYHDVEDDVWLVPTAEVPITNLYSGEILEPGTLPLHYVAYTPCFRREKMSAGRDVRGIKRGHQFDKVEMYHFTLPEASEEALQNLVDHAEDVCRALEIPYRVVQQCTGDLGFASKITFDLELWAPGVGEWLEVSSCSNCGDFQARRADIRFRRERGARPEYCHTLNGSGLALPRTVIAILENYQREDGSVEIPEVLRPYMGGLAQIPVPT